ncbi:MAG: SPFH domain-containing protein [Clostridia bacterium]|nr:SPFH domain-containing protein [Clostridia bacterium]
MALFKKNRSLMNQIRCDEASYLIWKWRPKDLQKDSNRENAIRWGSSLRVKDGEVAVFVYNQGNGIMQDFIEGPFDKIIETKNLPVLANIIGHAYNGGTPFQAEVYFINLARIIQISFAVPFFDIYDPRFLDFGVPTAVRGKVTFNIKNYREFIKLHRLSSFDLDSFQTQIRDSIARYVKTAIINVPAENNIPVVQIERALSTVNSIVEDSVRNRLEHDFGVNISAVDINTIELDKTSDGYKQLMAVTKNITAVKIQAETTDYTERLRIQREEDQYAKHKQTQSANIGTFQIEKQTEVGVAGANALGNMGKNGAGSINLGGKSSGFNPAAMMAGMTLGGAVGQNIAGTMNSAMNGMSQPLQNSIIPPPIPTVSYYVAINGQAAGAFDVNTLAQMKSTGQFNADSLVWKNGMTEWTKASNIDELKYLFTNNPTIPPIPNIE